MGKYLHQIGTYIMLQKTKTNSSQWQIFKTNIQIELKFIDIVF